MNFIFNNHIIANDDIGNIIGEQSEDKRDDQHPPNKNDSKDRGGRRRVLGRRGGRKLALGLGRKLRGRQRSVRAPRGLVRKQS